MIPDSYRTHSDDYVDIYGEERSHNQVVTQIENLGRGVYAVLIGGVMLAVLLAGMALMRTESASDKALTAEREAKLAREDIRIMQINMAAHHIETDEHATEKGK